MWYAVRWVSDEGKTHICAPAETVKEAIFHSAMSGPPVARDEYRIKCFKENQFRYGKSRLDVVSFELATVVTDIDAHLNKED